MLVSGQQKRRLVWQLICMTDFMIFSVCKISHDLRQSVLELLNVTLFGRDRPHMVSVIDSRSSLGKM